MHAWAAFQIYKLERRIHGHSDRLFLERVFQKLLLNFTWYASFFSLCLSVTITISSLDLALELNRIRDFLPKADIRSVINHFD